MEGASKHPTKSTQKGPHSARARPYCGVVHAGRQSKCTSNEKALDYYLSVEQNFRELSQQAREKVPIPAKAKEIDFSTEEPLADQEKEEDYELNLYISTFES